MKKTVVLLVILLASLSFAAEEKIIISIEGMTSKDCINKVKTALENVEGVQSAKIKLKPGEAIVIYDVDKTSGKNLLRAIAVSGYKVHGVKTVPSTTASSDTHSLKTTVKESHDLKQNAGQYQGTHSTGQKQESHPCPCIKQCKELIEFHKVMHPMHKALSENDYEAVRECYPELAEKAEAVKKMVCDEKYVKDTKAFEEKRTVLLKTIAELGEACKAKDDEKLIEAFDIMHEAYIELGNLAK